MPRPKPETPKVPVSVRVLQSNKDRLEAVADRRGLLLSDLVKEYLIAGLTRDERRYTAATPAPKPAPKKP